MTAHTRRPHGLQATRRTSLFTPALGIATMVVVVAMVASVRGTAPSATQRLTQATPPNIVVVLADDLGYSDLAAYGHPLHRTPNLDAMARDGVRATSAYAPSPSCSPTRASLLTGRYAFRVGIRAPLSPRPTRRANRFDQVPPDGCRANLH